MILVRKKTALSTVVTTLIILVVSVLLATIVTFYAINVTTTRVQEEALLLSKQHIWVNTTGSWSEAAFVLVNTGGRDIVLDKISIRGQESQWNNTYFWKTNTVTITNDLNTTNAPIAGATTAILIQGSVRTFTQTNDDLTLKSGWTMVVYVNRPDSISTNDVGTTCGITVFTANAEYYKETNVETSNK